MVVDFINRSEILEQDKPLARLILLNLMTIIEQYNRYIVDTIDYNRHIPYPKLSLEYKFLNNKLVIRFKGEHTQEAVDTWNIFKSYPETIEKLKAKTVKLTSDLEICKNTVEKERQKLEKEKEELQNEWKQFRSIQYKPEESKSMSEDEIREKLEKELKEEYKEYLDMLPS